MLTLVSLLVALLPQEIPKSESPTAPVIVVFKETADNESRFAGTLDQFTDITSSITLEHEGVTSYFKAVTALPSNNDDMILHATLTYYVYASGHVWGELVVRNDSMHHANGAVFGDLIVVIGNHQFSFKGGKLWDQTGWVVQLGKPKLAPIPGLYRLLENQWPKRPQMFEHSSVYWMGYVDVRGEQHNAHHMRQTGTPFGSDDWFEIFTAWLYNEKFPEPNGEDMLRPLLQNVYETIGVSARAIYNAEQGEEKDDDETKIRYLPNRPCLLSDYSHEGEQKLFHYNSYPQVDEGAGAPFLAHLGEGGIDVNYDRHRVAESFGRRNLDVANAWTHAENLLGRKLQDQEKPWYVKAVRDDWPNAFTGKRVAGWRYESEPTCYPGYGRSFFDPGHFNLITRFVSAAALTPSLVAQELVSNHCQWALDTFDPDPTIRDVSWSYRTRGWPTDGFLGAWLSTGHRVFLNAARRVLEHTEMAQLQGGAVNLSDPEGKKLTSGEDPPGGYFWFKAWQLSRWVTACRHGALVDPDEDWRNRWVAQGILAARAMALSHVPGSGFCEWVGFPSDTLDPVIFGPQEGVDYAQAGTVMDIGTRHWMLNGFAWASEMTGGEFEAMKPSWERLMARTSYPRYLWPDRSVVRWHLLCVRQWGHDGDLLE